MATCGELSLAAVGKQSEIQCCKVPRLIDVYQDTLALPFVGLSIGAFLDIAGLVACERAQTFSPDIFEWLWNVAGKKWLEGIPLWNNTANQFVKNGLHGKDLISQIVSIRRAVLPSKVFRPWIVQTSFRSLKATPHPCLLGVIPVYTAKPSRASVAVAVGSNHGQTLVIGIKFTAAGPASDNFCIGIQAIGSAGMICVSFAPFSGTCFIEHENGLTMATKVLPSVLEVLEGCAWIHVTENGGIRFLRRFQGAQLEDTGFVPPEMLPNWIQSYFGSVDIWLSDLEVAIDVSVEHSGCAFSTDMPVFNSQGTEIKTKWSVFGLNGENLEN